MLSPLSREASVGMFFSSHPLREVAPNTPGAEDDHVVRASMAHGLQERGPPGDVVGVARRRVASEAGFDVTYFRRPSGRRAVRPILPLTLQNLLQNREIAGIPGLRDHVVLLADLAEHGIVDVHEVR